MIAINNIEHLSKADAYRGSIIAALNTPTFHEIIVKKPAEEHIIYCSYIITAMDDLELNKEIVIASKELDVPIEKQFDFIDPAISMEDLLNSEQQKLMEIINFVAYKFFVRSRTVCSIKKGKVFDL